MTSRRQHIQSLFRKLQLPIAAFILFALVTVSAPARAETLTVSLNNALPDIGVVASGTAATTFTVANDGSVSVGAGGAQFVPSNATRTSTVTITINCSGGNKCKNNQVTVTVQAGATNNRRLGAITGFTADFASTNPATFASGTTSCTCTSMVFVVQPVATGTSGSRTFRLGMKAPVNTSGTLGAATATYTVSVSGTGYTSGTGTATMKADVQGKLGIQKTTDLNFGRYALVSGKSGTITWDAANQTLGFSAAGIVAPMGTPSPTIGAFLVTGTPGQQVNFSLGGNAGLPTKIRLSKSGGQTLDITPSTTAQSSQQILANGTLPFYVGGTISVSSGMSTGAYTGTFSITANYQ